jgi:hypothetical protein
LLETADLVSTLKVGKTWGGREVVLGIGGDLISMISAIP